MKVHQEASYRPIKVLPKWVDPEEIRRKEEALAALAKSRKSTRRMSSIPGDRNQGKRKDRRLRPELDVILHDLRKHETNALVAILVATSAVIGL